MPLLDIASSQPCSCFRNSSLAFRSETALRKVVVGNERTLRLASSFCITEKRGRSFTLGRAELWRGRLMIKAVGTLEITSVPCKNEGVNGYRGVLMRDVDSVKLNSSDFEQQSSSEDSTDVDGREKLRRMRISKANKGNTPWNKGRKHSPETIQRIKERTRLAMKDPKVKMKLANLGHAQSDETRMKIGVSVRLGWQKRREKLMLQDTCLFEWQNLVAVAARKGLPGEEELQWDSYKILDKQLKLEWLQSVEQRKKSIRPKGNKRAPKSAEQKRKISEAIAAKWADPDYRNRVHSGLARFHGIPEGVERKPKRKSAVDGETRIRKQKNKVDELAKRKAKVQEQLIRARRNRTPSYKDPLASSKLEMLKNIRAQRSASINNKTSEAVTRAKLLIAEAKKAAEALEIPAKTSPVARASLLESRTLIAEATRLIESVDIEDETVPFENDNDPSESSSPSPDLHKGMSEYPQNQEDIKVNGSHSIWASLLDSTDTFDFNNFVLPDLANGNGTSSHSGDHTLKPEEKLHHMSSNGALNSSSSTKNHPIPKSSSIGISVNGLDTESEPKKTIKKWVRGRLVEVAEEPLD